MIEFIFYMALVIAYVYWIQPPHKQEKLRLFGWICLIAAPIWIPTILIFTGLFGYLLLFVIYDPKALIPGVAGVSILVLAIIAAHYIEKKVILYLNKKFPSR